uniref:Uncharacterized protein n=2 Tax=Hemiselmis andersenii TaxID=464988 RepID=A0A7S0U2W8_HEMAN|mmetsp:Transcript_33707/g.78686  ORF Transcript_33707/g.78686 Transcript_33707/m.78686 type:complete len:423 (+) Transcript_33707:120-1388(+)
MKMVERAQCTVLSLLLGLCLAIPAAAVEGFVGLCPVLRNDQTPFLGQRPFGVAPAPRVAAGPLVGRRKTDSPLIALRGAVAGESQWVWVVLLQPDGKWSSATRLMCPPGCLVFDIDAVKKAAKAEFADELAGVSAAKLDVTVGDGGNVLEEDLLVSGLPNGKTKADPLLIHAPKPVTLTVYTRTGKDRKVVHNSTITFATNEKFEKFVATRDIWHMKRAKGRADERLSAITSLAEAVSASQQDGTFLLLDNPADELREDVSALKGGEKNRATGLEQQTTKALVSDATFQREFGNLSLVNGGEPVEIKVAGDSNVAFEVDGLVRNGWQLLLNSAKGTPTEGDVTEVRDTASRLREVLQNPSNYETLPESALSEFEGLREVVPVLSGYCFADSVKQVAESRGVRWVHTDGKGFAVEARVSKQSA